MPLSRSFEIQDPCEDRREGLDGPHGQMLHIEALLHTASMVGNVSEFQDISSLNSDISLNTLLGCAISGTPV